MNDLTIGIILAVKHGYKNGKTVEDDVKNFLSDYTCTKIEHCTDSVLLRILISCFPEYIREHKNPSWAVTEFFINKYGHFEPQDDITAIINCFQMAQVRDHDDKGNYFYVNGFHDFKFNELELKLIPDKVEHGMRMSDDMHSEENYYV